jgi:hypothetical protein
MRNGRFIYLFNTDDYKIYFIFKRLYLIAGDKLKLDVNRGRRNTSNGNGAVQRK